MAEAPTPKEKLTGTPFSGRPARVTATSFNCTRCGACCRRVDRAVPLGFPADFVGPTGDCVNLAPDGTCLVYEQRPDFCRIPVESYAESYAACATLIRHYGLPESLVPRPGLTVLP
jgi:hypothetical protein